MNQELKTSQANARNDTEGPGKTEFPPRKMSSGRTSSREQLVDSRRSESSTDSRRKIRKPSAQQKLIQPPMWSQRPKPPILIAPPIAPSTETVAKVEKKLVSEPYVPEERATLGTEEFDVDKFLQMLKVKAIEYNKKRKYKQLSEVYSEAITRFPDRSSFHCNRSFAFQKMEYYGKALDDATKAIEIDQEQKAAYSQRAAAYLGLGMLLNALGDYERLMKLCPKSSKVKCRYLHCQKALNKCIFDSLISDNLSEHETEDLVSFETIIVEQEYNGPRWRTEKITASFLWTMMKYFRNVGALLHRKYVYKILFDLEVYLKTLPSLVFIDLVGNEGTLTICGDIQGQYYDLTNLFDTRGFPNNRRKYLFNGNFIGKGSFSLEVAVLLFAFKLAYPNNFFIARGHHETIAMTKIFGFEKEVSTKYSPLMYQLFTRVFQWLPLAHCINKEILVLHGGLFSEDNVTLNTIKELKRNYEPTESGGLLTDILWSDPQKDNGRQKNFRGMGGILFGPDVTEQFLRENELEYIIRSHEYKPDGYCEDHDGKCITVFTAPNYCDTYGNKGSILVLTGKQLERARLVIEAQPHPNIPPLYYADSVYQILT